MGNSFENCGDNFEAVLKIILKIRKTPKYSRNMKSTKTFKIPKVEVSDINKLLKNIKIKKATGPDTIPPKLVKLSANIVDSHLCIIINKDLESNSFSDGAKIAS